MNSKPICFQQQLEPVAYLPSPHTVQWRTANSRTKNAVFKYFQQEMVACFVNFFLLHMHTAHINWVHGIFVCKSVPFDSILHICVSELKRIELFITNSTVCNFCEYFQSANWPLISVWCRLRISVHTRWAVRCPRSWPLVKSKPYRQDFTAALLWFMAVVWVGQVQNILAIQRWSCAKKEVLIEISCYSKWLTSTAARSQLK